MALLAGDRALRAKRPNLAMAGAGVLWALALLTKIHAWFLLPIIAVWSLVWLPARRAVPALVAWTLAGVGLFWLGWPWLWYDSWARLRPTWGRGWRGSSIMVQYFGQVFADRDVPWHYPWFYFTATVPVGLLALGAIGIGRGWRNRRDDPFPLLLLGTIVIFLGIFSTSVPVYDGERLFLHVFPAVGDAHGSWFGWLWDQRLSKRSRPGRARGLAARSDSWRDRAPSVRAELLQWFGRRIAGAERLGLELTYWNDAVDQVLLDRLAYEAMPGASAALVPTLYPGQGILTTNRALARRDIILSDEQEATRAEWLVVSRRTAYWRPEIMERLLGGEGQLVAKRSRQGVWIAAVWHFPSPKSSQTGRLDRQAAKSPSAVRAQNPNTKPFLPNDLRNLGPSH